MKNRLTKAFQGLKVEDADQGLVSAVFATLGVIDSDGDVSDKDTFTEGQEVRISAYNHASWGPGHLPVGKGSIRTTDQEAILDGRFFLSTEVGRETFTTVKEMGSLQEWSYGYDVDEAEPGTFEGQDVQFLRAVTVHEASPVILGAGVGTRTLEAKGKQLVHDVFALLRDAGAERWGAENVYVYVDDIDLDESWAVFAICADDDAARIVKVEFERGEDGSVALAEAEEEVRRTTEYEPKQKLTDQLASVVTDVEQVVQRAADVVAMRSEKGKDLGQEAKDLLIRLEPKLDQLRLILVPTNDDDASDALATEAARLEFDRAR